MRRNVYSSAVFTGGRPLCTQVLRGQDRPPSIVHDVRKLETLDSWTGSSLTFSNHFWRQKSRGTGLPDGEDRTFLHFLILTQYRSVTNRRTDRQMDGFAVAYTALTKLASRSAVKTNDVIVLQSLILKYPNNCNLHDFLAVF